MPVTLVDRLPLPNLKVYSAGSILLLAIAVYYAVNVTSDPNWRANATLQRQDVEPADVDNPKIITSPVVPTEIIETGTKNTSEKIMEVMAFMIQETLCMWGALGPNVEVDGAALDTTLVHLNNIRECSFNGRVKCFLDDRHTPESAAAGRKQPGVFGSRSCFCFAFFYVETLINTAYCSLAVFGLVVQRAVFGELRVSEAARLKDKLWNYAFYKFMFVFGVLNVQYMDEVLLWCSWFTLVGFLHLLGHLCRDRFDYLSSSPNVAGWAHARILGLLLGILLAAAGLFSVAITWGLPAGKNTFAFMAAECALVGVSALHVVARFVLRARDADAAGAPAYYTHLLFDAVALVMEVCHVAHMVVYSNVVVSMASLVLLMQLRHLLHALLARLRRHRLYTALATHMSRNYPMASPEEVEKNQDNCAICWEPMKEARKLPCSHLFHNSCLCRWVQQDASCPTCRRSLSAAPDAPASPLAPLTPLAEEPRHPNHLFHFDGSRYVSWLPSFSVEVTRVRDSPPAQRQLEAMVAQVQQVFPQYGRALLLADLAATGSADLTLDNILEGRLHPANNPTTSTAAVTTPAHDADAAPTVAPVEESPAPSASAAAPAASVGTAAAALGAALDDSSDTDVLSTADAHFYESAAEREADLRRRRERLVAAARRRFHYTQ